MRYLSQRYEVSVPLPSGPLGPDLLERLHEDFYAAYRKHYGRDIREVPVETVSWRLTVSSAAPKLPESWPSHGSASSDITPKARRPVSFVGQISPIDCPVYQRDRLLPGARLSGPAIIEDLESTTVVPPGAGVTVDALRMLVISLQG
jgi:N-methylhydantoinase A